MPAIAAPITTKHSADVLSGTPRAHAIDRWIFVFMAGWFNAITLAGFIPSSLEKIELVRSGLRPLFPLVMHMHAVLLGAFLLLLLAQTWRMATGRAAYQFSDGEPFSTSNQSWTSSKVSASTAK